MANGGHDTYWTIVWTQFRRHRLGMAALGVVAVFAVIGIYAPFLASSKPLVVRYDGNWYFPLFAYLFHLGFFTKRVDIFYNLLMFTLPFFVLACCLPKRRLLAFGVVAVIQMALFAYLAMGVVKDPASDPSLNRKKYEDLQKQMANRKGDDPLLAPLPVYPTWDNDLAYMNSYAKLNLVMKYWLRKEQDVRLSPYQAGYDVYAKKKKDAGAIATMPTLWEMDRRNEEEEIARQRAIIQATEKDYPAAKQDLDRLLTLCRQWRSQLEAKSARDDADKECQLLHEASSQERLRLSQMRSLVDRYDGAEAKMRYLQARRQWLEQQSNGLQFMVMPLLRHFHWEDDAGGEQSVNQYIGWMERTRINRKDLLAGLIFGVRISLMVGALAVGLALAIGIPVGAMAGYYAGTIDIVVCRLMEIWEAMPTFFMLLMVVAITQSKSIFLVIGVIGIFGWTSFSRYVRGEFFKQRNLLYVEACHALGFRDSRIIFGHVLPNAIPPVLTLLPFAVMAAITAEAGLSFLGLGEEGSCSWGVLMDEGRTAFPGESYLLWPPAIMLTILLVAIALVGDALRDALDPRMRRS